MYCLTRLLPLLGVLHGYYMVTTVLHGYYMVTMVTRCITVYHGYHGYY